MRKAYLFFLFVACCVLILASLFFHAERAVRDFAPVRDGLGVLTSSLLLTDMFFSHDARYTRHPSQADLFSAFQEHPGSIEHFPSGSVIPPPDFSAFHAGMTVKKR